MCLKKEQRFKLGSNAVETNVSSLKQWLVRLWEMQRSGRSLIRQGILYSGGHGLFCTSHVPHGTHFAIHEWRCFPWCVSEELFWWKARTHLSFYETGTKRNKFHSLSWHHQLHWQEIPIGELQPGSPHALVWKDRCLPGKSQNLPWNGEYKPPHSELL